MRRESLDRAIGPTPPSFSGRMEQTLHTLKEEKEVKRIGFRTIMVFAIIATLSCTTACALVSQGLEWYYNNRFTAYQEHEPDKYHAIISHLQTEVPQSAAQDPDVRISVDEVSWVPEEHILVVSVTAAAAKPEQYELHPMWNLDADGSYVGKEHLGEYAADEEARGEHWLWTGRGYGPVAEMVAPGKQLLLLEAEEIRLEALRLLGDMSSTDAYVTEDGAVHVVIELHLAQFFDPTFPDTVAQRIKEAPEYAVHWQQLLSDWERFQQLLHAHEDGVVTLTLPYSVTTYSEDDVALYTGGRKGEVQFDVKLR
ncbi:MAG: hypothetical protein PUC00_06805 [Clostridiales bacterium]|nr:hypothetical protein [Clostridiales bacterium]